MERQYDRNEISEFYGTFCEEEKSLKLNLRHYSVFYHLVKAGLRRNHSVLEIGCGFGTITSLIARYLTQGKLVATDISKERIESCRRNLGKYKNASFVLTDMTDFIPDGKFDLIVLPDVLEHIPEEAHFELFRLMSQYLNEDGLIFIHLPHPTALDYVRKHNPEALQIIDQSIATDGLLRNAYSHGLRLEQLRSYSLGKQEHEYQIIVFCKNRDYPSMTSRSTSMIRWDKLRKRWFLFRKLVFG